MFTRDAIALAQQRGLDLVEVAPNEVPPVCKLMDYGKFKYDQTKKERDARKTQKQVILKEVRLSPKIDEHDIDYRTKMVRRFLDEGNKVKLTVKFKGRELAHTNLGRDVLEQVRLTLGDNVIIEAPPKMEGKSMTMILAPRPAKSAPRPVRLPSAADGISPAPAPAIRSPDRRPLPQLSQQPTLKLSLVPKLPLQLLKHRRPNRPQSRNPQALPRPGNPGQSNIDCKNPRFSRGFFLCVVGRPFKGLVTRSRC